MPTQCRLLELLRLDLAEEVEVVESVDQRDRSRYL